MWESTFDAIQDPVFIIGKNYTIERANVAAAGRSGSEGTDIRKLVGQKCYQTFAQRTSVCPQCPLKETLRRGKARSVEIQGLIPGAHFQVNSYPIGSEKGRSVRVVHHYRDVTKERMLQRRLVQSEKMAAIGMLAGGVAHEINNPLAGILAFTQLLQKELSAEGQAQEDLKEVEQAAKRCKKIVEDLLLFSRPSTDDDRRSLILPEAIEKILPLLRLDLRHRNVSLATDYQPNLPSVVGSAARLQQVFLNLIQNAVQSMPHGGIVTLKVYASKDRHCVMADVVDTGQGIRREDLPRIFDPFFSTKHDVGGTGLGLSICYSIISDHHGSIEVESRPGKGSCFRVLLPVTRAA